MRGPDFGSCCLQGKVDLPSPQYPPHTLRNLFDANDVQARDFQNRIWQYNRAFAFTSMGVRQDHSVNGRSRGPPVFRIQGELSHHIGALTPSPGKQPVYAQLYFYDPATSLRLREQNNTALRRDTLQLLQSIIERHHPYVGIYRQAYETAASADSIPDYAIVLRATPDADPRTHNLPTTREVAVILPDDPEQSASEYRDILLRYKEGPLFRIHANHPSYQPLHYVLLFPYGEHGWYPELRLSNVSESRRQSLTIAKYVTYQIHTRPNQYSLLHRGRSLFERWMVDMFAIM